MRTLRKREGRKFYSCPAVFRDTRFQDFDHTGNEETLQFVKDYIDTIEDRWIMGDGLFIYGKPGLGKTMLSSIIGHAAAEIGHWVGFIRVDFYVHTLREMISLLQTEQHEEYLKKREIQKWAEGKYAFLIFDDLGKEYAPSEFAPRAIESVLRARHHEGLPTIITSNLSPDEVTEQYGEALGSFLHEICSVVKLRGTDRRRHAGR